MCRASSALRISLGQGRALDGRRDRAPMRKASPKNGRALFPPHASRGSEEPPDEDALAIVAFLHAPARGFPEAPGAKVARFPMPVVIRFIPKPLTGR